MRVNVRALVAPLLMTLAATAARGQAAGCSKIAYVNPQALFQAAPGRADAQAAYQKETETYRGELTKMSEALTAMVADFQKNESKLLAPDKLEFSGYVGIKLAGRTETWTRAPETLRGC